MLGKKLLVLFLVFILTNFFVVNIHAQENFMPPLYCMGMGADCSDTPEPSVPPINLHRESVPCSNSRSQTNFFANVFEYFYAFFNPQYRAQREAPCPSEAPLRTGSGNLTSGSEPERSNSGIEFVSHAITQVGGEDMFITAQKLNNTQPGDILIAMIGSDYAHVETAPPGWVLIRQDVKNAGHIDDLAMQSYYKIVTYSEDDSYTWELATGREDTPSEHQPLIAVDLYAFRGVDSDDPIFSSDGHGETQDPKEIECPSVGGIAGGMLICAYIGDDPGPVTAPGSMTQTSDFEIAGGDTYAIAYEALTSDGDTGARIAQWDNPGRNSNGTLKSGSDFAQAVVLRPMK